MRISILTLFPEMFEGFSKTSIIKRAQENALVTLECVDFRKYTLDKHQHVDDTPCGGGSGMILKCQPIVDCLKDIRTPFSHVVLMSPRGETFKQEKARSLVTYEHLILICGHYEGLDERILAYVDEEISIGDYILTGGEIAAMAISDAIIRLINGVIKSESNKDDSFENGLLEYPQYTRPIDFEGSLVPDILLSGHHDNIRKWRLEKSLALTLTKRPDLLEKRIFSKEEYKILEKIRKN